MSEDMEIPEPDYGLPKERLFKVAEVAAFLRISKMTVYRLIESGELPVLRLSEHSIRIPRGGLRDYLTKVGAK